MKPKRTGLSLAGQYSALWSLLDRSEKRSAVLLLLCMFVAGLLELVGIASIVPLIAVLTDPSSLEKNSLIKSLYDGAGFKSIDGFLIFLGLLTISLVCARAIGTVFANYATIRFAQGRAYRWGTQVLRSYLVRPYAWFITRNTSDLSKTVLSETEEIVNNCLLPAFNLISQSIVSAFIILLVVYAEPAVAAIVTSTIGAVYGIIYLASRKLIAVIGKDTQKTNSRRYAIVGEALRCAKEIKIAGAEASFVKAFSDVARLRAKRNTQRQIVKDIPRSALELIAVAGGVLFILVLVWRSHGQVGDILTTLALYVFAGTRLMPSIQKIFHDLVQLRSTSHLLVDFQRELKPVDLPAPATATLDTRPLDRVISIELNGVCFQFANSERIALNDVSISIRENAKVAIVGPSGSGKSTLLDVLLGLLPPQTGTVLINGLPLSDDIIRRWHRTIGYVPQDIHLIDDTIEANIALSPDTVKADAVALHRAAQLAVIDEFIRNDLPNGFQTKMSASGFRLSGGQKQRVGIARALYRDPSVIILDEATSALDPIAEHAVVRNISALSKTVILVTHRIASAKYCDTVILMDRGRIKTMGSYEDLMKFDQNFRGLHDPTLT